MMTSSLHSRTHSFHCWSLAAMNTEARQQAPSTHECIWLICTPALFIAWSLSRTTVASSDSFSSQRQPRPCANPQTLDLRLAGDQKVHVLNLGLGFLFPSLLAKTSSFGLNSCCQARHTFSLDVCNVVCFLEIIHQPLCFFNQPSLPHLCLC